MNNTELKALKDATNKLTRWDSSGNSFGHFDNISSGATTISGSDRIYEFYCLMRLLEDLLINYDVRLVPGVTTNKLFPKSPANKRGWPYFEIENKYDSQNKFQVCYGTKIKLSDSPTTKIAPDISIQKINSTDDPDETMVDLIMDAKFKYDKYKALPVNQIHAFIQIVKALKTHNGKNTPLNFDKLTDLKTNCLLTNGKGVDIHEQYCINNDIKQVEKFNVGDQYHIIG